MEEVSSCSHLMFKLGAGFTAPPPTPIRRPGVDDTASSANQHFDQNDVDTLWMSATASTPVAVELVDDDGYSGIMCRNSTPPSRAELDDLALYLTQQSLLSTPTLLASPSLRRKRGNSPSSSMGASVATIEGATDDQGHGNNDEESQRQIAMVGGGRTETYRYSMEGFCEESKTAILRTCEKEGAFYVQITDMGKASLDGIHHVSKQYLGISSMCLIGSCPVIPFCELMSSMNDLSGTVPSCPQEESGFELSLVQDAETDANFRERVTEFARLFVEISKELLKFLLEEVCLETRNNLRVQSLKPLLYVYEYNNQISEHDEDVVLSIISQGNVKCGANIMGEPLLIILGNCLQSWSQGKFKRPTLPPLCNFVDKEVCLQLDLKRLL